MLKDLTTNQLSRIIFILEHFDHFLKDQIVKIDEQIYNTKNEKSAFNSSQLFDLIMFYTEQMNNNSAALDLYCKELEFKELSAFD